MLAPPVPATVPVHVLWSRRLWVQIVALGWHPCLRYTPQIPFQPEGKAHHVRTDTRLGQALRSKGYVGLVALAGMPTQSNCVGSQVSNMGDWPSILGFVALRMASNLPMAALKAVILGAPRSQVPVTPEDYRVMPGDGQGGYV